MDIREEFELHYAEEFSIVRGYKPSPEEMVSMRDGDGYGSDRGYLNGYWKGWQESRKSLAVELPENYPFNKQPKYESDRAQTIRECREAIEAQGIRTK